MGTTEGSKGMFEIFHNKNSTIAETNQQKSLAVRKKKLSLARPLWFEISTMNPYEEHEGVINLFLLTYLGIISGQIR